MSGPGFDSKCLDLARHFLPKADETFLSEMAQAFQDVAETAATDWEGEHCPDGTQHDLERREDWEGDPNVINGTRTLYYDVCRKCGREN